MAQKKAISKVAKKAVEKTSRKAVKKGESYKCGVCGLAVTVDEICGCVETCDIICCERPMKLRRRA